MFNCSTQQEDRLKKAEKIIEGLANKNLFKFKDNKKSQINFYCGENYKNFTLDEETDFWKYEVNGNYYRKEAFPYPVAKPKYLFEKDKIKRVDISLFQQNRAEIGIELHEMLHGLGLRKHYGIWMKKGNNIERSYVHDLRSRNKLKEIYKL